MKKTIALVIGIMLCLPLVAGAQMGYGHQYDRGGRYETETRGRDWNYCPYCGRGFHHRGRHGMGPYGYGGGDFRQWDDPDRWDPVDEAEARSMIERMLDSRGNPNLKLGDMSDKGSYFEADIVTREGSLVDRLQVHKETGRMRSAYRSKRP